MKTNLFKRIVTIAAAVAVTLAIGAGGAFAADNGNGTISDNAFFNWQTIGVAWLKNANCFGQTDWFAASSNVGRLKSGMCGLTDGSKAGDWRLPTRQELQARFKNRAGFINVQPEHYWTSELYSARNEAWVVSHAGEIGYENRTMKSYMFAWPIRSK